jgi:CubicO group peptidase (beta-lactamase class C family)
MNARETLDQVGVELRERVAEAATRLNVPGVAVGVLLDGEEDYVCHGVTSITDPLPVDEGTLFQIGSTTKTYTATAMMVLVERGLVELDAPVRSYLPDFKLKDESVAANVKVLQLFNHTAGWAGDFVVDTGYGDDALARFVERLAEANQEHPLGERVSYNNASLAVAGRIIEVVTGKTYEAAMQELVFDPLGLKEHFFFAWDIMTRRFANGHAYVGDALQVTPWYEARASHPPGAELTATTRDQLRYARFHMGDGSGVLSRATLDLMQTPTTPAPDGSGGAPSAMYGISWHLRDLGGARVVSHGGSNRGQQSAFEMVPERGFALAIQTNARHGLELLTELVEWCFAAYLGLAEELPEPLDLSAEQLAEYVGVYESHTGDLAVAVVDDHLLGTMTINPEMLAEMGEQDAGEPVPPVPFRILPNNQFLIFAGTYKGLRGGIVRDEAGKITGLDLGRIFTRRE